MDISLREETYLSEDRSWLASQHGTEAIRSVTLDVSAFTEATHFPNGFIPSGMGVAELNSGLFGPYAGRANEVQQFDLGAASAGDFTITFDGETTGNIAFGATAAAVQTALEALSNINPGDADVTGGPLPGTAVVITFGGQYAGENVPEITIDGTGLTDGTVTISTTTQGGTAADGESFAGHLFTSTQIRGTADVGASLFEHGFVVEANLPANHGLDAAAKADVAGWIKYR